MSRNDIRLRRQRLAGNTSRFRNYGNVLERHERDLRIRKIVRVFTYFAIILIVVMLIIILSRTERRFEEKPRPATSFLHQEIDTKVYEGTKRPRRHACPPELSRRREDTKDFFRYNLNHKGLLASPISGSSAGSAQATAKHKNLVFVS